MKTIYLTALLAVISSFSCTNTSEGLENRSQMAQPIFHKIPESISGIGYKNLISENDSINILRYEYLYNGAGVAVGDFNNDGLPDTFFAGNQVNDRLYMNKGNMKFEDVSEESNIASKSGWSTGVSVVDINSDGFLDIYVCRSNKKVYRYSKNVLWVNNQDGTFTEMAEAYGLAITPSATHAAFFDYDKDSDLDVFILIDEYDTFDPNSIRPRRTDGSAPNTDMLLENIGIDAQKGHVVYRDVSNTSGIVFEGYGLGVSISDINGDSWPDIYVSNDYNSNDILYMNKGNGTFENKVASVLRHQATSSMGCDIADFNNDGLVDIISLDMLPKDIQSQKLMIGFVENTRLKLQTQMGYEPQFIRNMLQVHQGMDAQGEPYFSEIGQLSGVYKTGWSWGPLFADFDNDGNKDLFITNGIPKDLTNLDYIDYRKSSIRPGTDAQTFVRLVTEYMANLDYLKDKNQLFLNNGNLTFLDPGDRSGLTEKICSNGASYADLDNDGDLDLVINNLNATSAIYRNNTRENGLDSNFLKVALSGETQNKSGVGAKVTLYQGKELQYVENNPYRGFQSSTMGPMHFGLGTTAKIDSVKVVWPSGKQEISYGIASNQTISFDASKAMYPTQKDAKENPPLFERANEPPGINFKHSEPAFNDFNYAPLLLHKFSKQGPGIAVGDIDNNGLEDIFIGGAYKQSGTFFLQTEEGTFSSQNLIIGEKKEEDTGVLLFDADGDGDQDLYVVSGSGEYGASSKYYQDRLYGNDGNGNFKKLKGRLPEINVTGSIVAAADYDKDGDLDLFRGGRVAITKYPESVKSFLLRNDNGKFTDVTANNAPGLLEAGMVTSALWTDIDNDTWLDLIVVGEWMPITIYRNDNGTLTKKIDVPQSGFWNSVSGGDFDNDGDIDYVLGNLGLNSSLKASNEHPLTIFSDDLNNDGVIDGIINSWEKDTAGAAQLVPIHPRNTLFEQLIGLKKAYPDYASYATETTEGLLQKIQLNDIPKKYINETRTGYLENLGDFKFRFKPLPIEAQFAPVNGTLATDVNNDGNLDILLVGNDYAVNALIGQYDALNGLVLLGDGKGNFALMEENTGFHVPDNAKALALLYNKRKEPLVIATRNDATSQVFKLQKQFDRLIRPLENETHAMITFNNGKKRKVEFYRGGSYLSQSSKAIPFTDAIASIIMVAINGKERVFEN
ncbi:VCBS repeat-containing protein [Maribacter sp. 2307ULW6-5]|uniref:VCBS repeat-containing protein n=1 Tax=Maribacter sp. 2307ULW6-5 TaxID=3386275 RepID=UPI0039BC6A02